MTKIKSLSILNSMGANPAVVHLLYTRLFKRDSSSTYLYFSISSFNCSTVETPTSHFSPLMIVVGTKRILYSTAISLSSCSATFLVTHSIFSAFISSCVCLITFSWNLQLPHHGEVKNSTFTILSLLTNNSETFYINLNTFHFSPYTASETLEK